mmetsp:Transcript_47667/g.53342  ORF Transcript_47667/g.53342 Transcript_47667/m.53342 type:complete len:301 (+) Transcript_47667:539-1441(+)
MEEAYKLSQKGLRKCVPNDVCLMVGISKLRPNDYSVTMYNTNNLLLDNNNSKNATTIHTSSNNNDNNNNNDNGNNVTSISGVSYRDGKKFPYFLGSDFVTFTEVEGTEGTCLLNCPSPNQSLLEFDYWTGEVVTSPFWIVTTAEDDTGMASDDSIFLDHNIDKTIIGGCSYHCNYPQQRLIHESICLDHTTNNVNSATSSTNTNTNVNNNKNKNNNDHYNSFDDVHNQQTSPRNGTSTTSPEDKLELEKDSFTDGYRTWSGSLLAFQYGMFHIVIYMTCGVIGYSYLLTTKWSVIDSLYF